MPTSISNPLRTVKCAQLQQLGKTLWDWSLCGGCDGRPTCSGKCPWTREKRLEGFWNWYKEMTAAYVPELLTDRPAALKNHNDLLEIIRFIKRNPNVERSQLTQEYFTSRSVHEGRLPARADQGRAFTLAASILIMVNCSVSSQSYLLLVERGLLILWRDKTSMADYVEEVFREDTHPLLYDGDDTLIEPSIVNELAASSLKKRAGLKVHPTNDLRNHLKLDRRQGIVQVFHLTAVLKEDLMASEKLESDAKVSDFVTEGNLPRRLALETLDTIHKVLFPLDDKDAQKLLKSFIAQGSFDEDCLYFESARFRGDDNEDSSYLFFAHQLAQLYREIENPTPRGWFQSWLERRSRARHVLLATLIGVIIAVVLGILGLGVASFQAWLGWQQWKHPTRVD